MKKTACYIFLSVLLIFACAQKQTSQDEILANTPEQNKKENTEAIEEEEDEDLFWQRDSLKKLDAVKQAIEYVMANKHEKYIEKTFQEEDESYKGRLIFENHYRYGNLFSGNHKHLFIRVGSMPETQFHVYLLKNNTFSRVLYFSMTSIALTGDSIIDRNGDGVKDLDIEWYAMAGCCLRESHEVHLCKPDGTFTDSYHFINPTFNTKTKIIRGVDYGHPGRTPLYKYQWNGFSEVDTIEYIYPNIKDTVNYTYIKVKSWRRFEDINDSDNIESNLILNELPSEYLIPENLKEDYLNWFSWYNPNSFTE